MHVVFTLLALLACLGVYGSCELIQAPKTIN